jgi:sugar O-acyltransferase (sialic acid O-acetyltransferase NeuD family)
MMSRAKLIILGTRLYAEEVADLVGDDSAYELAGFGENWERERCRAPFLGLPVHWVDDLPALAATHVAVCAIGTPKRAAYITQVEGMGFRFATIVHPTARISRTARVGAGSIVSAGVVIAAHTTIGRHVIVNRGSLLGHHTEIGDCVTISPGANIAGCVRIGPGAYVGMGAIVVDRITVGAAAFVGAGAIVVRDVPPAAQVMGTTARMVRAEDEGR